MKIFDPQQIFNPSKVKKIAIIGFPNSGKSSLFRLLTDFHGKTNYETTYELVSQDAIINTIPIKVIDLPGIYSLNSSQPSEKITKEFLLNKNYDLIVNIVDSTMLSRNLKLTIELIELGIPVILILNFEDELRRRRTKLDINKIKEQLGIPVLQFNGRLGLGIKELGIEISNSINNKNLPNRIFEFTYHLETKIELIAKEISKINSTNLPDRFIAIKFLEDSDYFKNFKNDELIELRNQIKEEIYKEHRKSLLETISYERNHIAMQIAEDSIPKDSKKKIPLQDKIDMFISHPFFGYLVLIAIMFLIFFTVFFVGNFLSSLFETPLYYLSDIIKPLKTTQPFIWNSLNGGLMGIVGAVGIVLPYFLPLVFLNTILEETGYMSRLVLLIDNLMHKVGLHGKSIIPFILGIGCSVPAIYSTRMMENRRDRIITAILIPFIPCSARLTVIFALSAAFTGPIWVIVIFLYLISVISLSSIFLSRLLPESTGLLMDIVPLKVPSIKMSFLKTWSKVREFLGEALLFLVVGGVLLGWIEYFHISNLIDKLFSPIVTSILGLPKELGSTLLFGFFRKELILVMANQAMNISTISELPLTLPQVMTFIIFVSLYFPCLSTFIVLLKEFKSKITLISSISSIVLALISALIFKIILNLYI